MAKFTGGSERACFFASARPEHRRGPLLAPLAGHDAGVGARPDGIRSREMGAAAGGRVNSRVSAVWKFAWFVSAGNTRSPRQCAWRVGRDDCGTGGDFVCISIYERGVYLVRDDWGERDVCDWLRGGQGQRRP